MKWLKLNEYPKEDGASYRWIRIRAEQQIVWVYRERKSGCKKKKEWIADVIGSDFCIAIEEPFQLSEPIPLPEGKK